MTGRGLTVVLASAAALAAPATAQAALVDFVADRGEMVMVFRAAPGEAQQVTLSTLAAPRGWVRIADANDLQLAEFVDQYCTDVSAQSITCPMPNGFDVQLGDGNDRFAVKEKAGTWPSADGFTGEPWVTVGGGPGDDVITAGPGDDIVEGGDGADILYEGAGGNDIVRGGAGDDELGYHGSTENIFADEMFAGTDVYEGGPGTDLWDSGTLRSGVDVSFDGVANDQIAGTTDNVGADLEDFYGTDGNDRFTGNDAPNDAFGGNGDDVLDGRGGNDKLRGYNDDDTLTGGPGVDSLDGAYGNDRILARDGEVDAVYCGFGADSAQLDAATLDEATNCETEDRPAAAPPAPGPRAPSPIVTPTETTKPAPTLILRGPSAVKLSALLRGVPITVQTPGAGRGLARLFHGSRVIAQRRFSASRAGSTKVRLTPSRRARSTLRRLRGKKLRVRVTFTPRGGKAVTRSRTLRVR